MDESGPPGAHRDPVAEAPGSIAGGDAYYYARPPLPERDLVLVARERLRDAPRAIDARALQPRVWQGDDRLSVAQRETLAEWPRSAADLDRLDALGWPRRAIGVWAFPYIFDMHRAAGVPVEEAADACLQWLQSKGSVPASWHADQRVNDKDRNAEDRVGPNTLFSAEDDREQADPERANLVKDRQDAHGEQHRAPRTRSVAPQPNRALTPMVPYFPSAYSDAYRRLRDEFDRRPRQDEVASELKVSPATFKRYLKATKMLWPPA